VCCCVVSLSLSLFGASAADKSDLKIRENKDKSVYIEGVTEEYVTCAEDVIRVMDTGSANRKVAATSMHLSFLTCLVFSDVVLLAHGLSLTPAPTPKDMNDVSSRSHSIFVWNVEQKNLQNGTTMSGKLYLVDLAGSEKVGKTGATGNMLCPRLSFLPSPLEGRSLTSPCFCRRVAL
jgi:kinesin family protein 5